MQRLGPALAAIAAAMAFLAAMPPSHVHASCAPLPPLETAVSETPIIAIGTVAEMAVLPLFDPSTPDALIHYPYFTIDIEEYMKGSGSSTMTIRETGFSYLFDAGGNVVIQQTSVQFFAENSVGKRYLLFLPSLDPIDSPACTWSQVLGAQNPSPDGMSDEQLIERIRQLLQATPVPSASAAPTSVATASTTPAPPAALPASGGPPGESAGAWLVVSAVIGVLVAAAGVARRYR